MTEAVATTTSSTSSISPDSTLSGTVLGEIDAMLRSILDEYGLDDGEAITMDTTFHDDLELESIDLVTLGGRLEARYGSRVNFAEFIAELELDEIIALTVGRLVDYVVASLTISEREA